METEEVRRGRYRITSKGSDLLDRVSSGDFTLHEEIETVEFLVALFKNPYLMYAIMERNPIAMGKFNRYIKEGYIEEFTDPALDLLEKSFTKPKTYKPDDLVQEGEYEITEAGKALMSIFLQDFALSPWEHKMAEYLYKYCQYPDETPTWALGRLVKAGYLVRSEEEEEET